MKIDMSGVTAWFGVVVCVAMFVRLVRTGWHMLRNILRSGGVNGPSALPDGVNFAAMNPRTRAFRDFLLSGQEESKQSEDWKQVTCTRCGRPWMYARHMWVADDLDVCHECDPARAEDRAAAMRSVGIDPDAPLGWKGRASGAPWRG